MYPFRSPLNHWDSYASRLKHVSWCSNNLQPL